MLIKSKEATLMLRAWRSPPPPSLPNSQAEFITCGSDDGWVYIWATRKSSVPAGASPPASPEDNPFVKASGEPLACSVHLSVHFVSVHFSSPALSFSHALSSAQRTTPLSRRARRRTGARSFLPVAFVSVLPPTLSRLEVSPLDRARCAGFPAELAPL